MSTCDVSPMTEDLREWIVIWAFWLGPITVARVDATDGAWTLNDKVMHGLTFAKPHPPRYVSIAWIAGARSYEVYIGMVWRRWRRWAVRSSAPAPVTD